MEGTRITPNKKALFLLTNHRVSEKILPVIPKLSEYYDVDVFLVGLHSPLTPWVGDLDERKVIQEKYGSYINNIIVGPGIQFHGDKVADQLHNYVDIKSYSCLIFDDNRPLPEFNVPNFYQHCKGHSVPVIANSHGNEDQPYRAEGVAYDRRMILGKKEKRIFESGILGGIPANDSLKGKTLKPKHILLITNFLGRHLDGAKLFSNCFDERFVAQSGLVKLSEMHKLPILVKLKTRLDDKDYKANERYVQDRLPCEIISNTLDIDTTISESALVISAPSTLSFKPIQLGIPTVLIKGAGAVGNYFDYEGLVDLNEKDILNSLESQVKRGRSNEFIESTVTGGVEFNSTELYVENLLNNLKDK